MTQSKDKNTQKIYEHFYVARQPIFDRSGGQFGFELLFRSDLDMDRAVITDQDFATICVATSGFIDSQDIIGHPLKVCINFTERLLLEGAPRALPASVTVIEILEHVSPSPRILTEINTLKSEGYMIAIDDYVGDPSQKELLNLADIIKVDIRGRSQEEIKELFHSIKDTSALKLAEKVASPETHVVVRQLGFDLFQGFFFAKPANFGSRKLEASKLSKLRILSKINNPDLDINTLVSLIQADPSITYRLLRFLNSASFGFSSKIESVRHAITLLGIRKLKHWLRMVVLSDLAGADETPEIYLMAVNRGKFLEELTDKGQISGPHPETMFLFGMLSLIDTMLDMPFEQIIEDLPLSDKIKAGYTDKNSAFHACLDLVQAIEKGRTEDVEMICEEQNISPHRVAECSVISTGWTNTVAREAL